VSGSCDHRLEPHAARGWIAFQQPQRHFIGCRNMGSRILVWVNHGRMLGSRMLPLVAACPKHGGGEQCSRETGRCPCSHGLNGR
jgi:hypothetical protein